MLGEFATAIISMILFVVIIVALAVVIKKYGKNGVFFGKQIGQERNIKVLERCAVSQNQFLLIVEVAGQTMLLGITNNHIERIADIDSAELIPKNETSFSQILENVKGKTNEEKDS
ncbi:MAG: flagellar biosynthetic protein FliO [Oscillospiraceae bacterium]|jgi:flagellar biosynthetic protein FliO|nr:flagellar biosynthetic protein FliO [Oscillospiraceae bacterium]